MTTRQKLSALSLGAVLALIAAAFMLTFAGCATVSVRPCRHAGVELTSERLGWAGPPMLMPGVSALGFHPPVGSIAPGLPATIRVTVHNGRSYALKVWLDCGEVGAAAVQTVAVVGPEQERDLYFSVPRRVGPQAFECRIADATSVVGETR